MSSKTLQSPLHDVASAKPIPLQTARAADLVSSAIKRMYDEDVGALAVVEGNRLVGIFTERDALYRIVHENRDPAATSISEVMTRDPEAASPYMTVIDALRMVTEQRFRHLPLVEQGELVGLLSSGDLTRWSLEAHDAELRRRERTLLAKAARNKTLLALLAGLIGLAVLAALTG